MKSVTATLPALDREIPVRGMKVKELDLLTNQAKMANGDALNEIFNACIEDKDINHLELLSADRNAVLIAIRRATFGDIYEFRAQSPHAQEKKLQDFEIDLKDLALIKGDRDMVKQFIADKNHTFTFKLPSDGKMIKWRFTDGNDFKKALSIYKGVNKATQDLLLRIVDVEGIKEEGIPLKRFVADMEYSDMADFNEYYMEKAPAIDDEIELICQETGLPFKATLEFSVENFFKRNSRKSNS